MDIDVGAPICAYEMRDYHGDNAVVDFLDSEGNVILSVGATTRMAREMVSMIDMLPIQNGEK